jgi:hypothetical protein
LHIRKVETKQSFTNSANELTKLRNKEKRILDRYKSVRAPYRKKGQTDEGFVYIKDERKAKKMEEYSVFADEDLPE